MKIGPAPIFEPGPNIKRKLVAMPGEHLRSDEDVEEILKLAMEKSSVDGDLLRQRLTSTARELGISEEQLQEAEEEYRAKKEALAAQEAEEAARQREQKESRVRFWRFMATQGLFAALAIAFIVVASGSSGFNFGWFMWVPMVCAVKAVRRGRRLRETGTMDGPDGNPFGGWGR